MRKAAELIGGREKLARTLKVAPEDVEKWIADKGKPRREVFLRVVDLIIDDNGIADASAPGDAPPSRDAAGAAAWLE